MLSSADSRPALPKTIVLSRTAAPSQEPPLSGRMSPAQTSSWASFCWTWSAATQKSGSLRKATWSRGFRNRFQPILWLPLKVPTESSKGGRLTCDWSNVSIEKRCSILWITVGGNFDRICLSRHEASSSLMTQSLRYVLMSEVRERGLFYGSTIILEFK